MHPDEALELCDDIESLLEEVPPRWQGIWVQKKQDLITDLREKICEGICTERQEALLNRIKDEIESKLT